MKDIIKIIVILGITISFFPAYPMEILDPDKDDLDYSYGQCIFGDNDNGDWDLGSFSASKVHQTEMRQNALKKICCFARRGNSITLKVKKDNEISLVKIFEENEIPFTFAPRGNFFKQKPLFTYHSSDESNFIEERKLVKRYGKYPFHNKQSYAQLFSYYPYCGNNTYEQQQLMQAISEGHRTRQKKFNHECNSLKNYVRDRHQIEIPEDLMFLIISHLASYCIHEKNRALIKRVKKKFEELSTLPK